MALLTALEDLRERTLAALPTLWEKLAFLRDCRRQDGVYQHWGLERTHGEIAGRDALAQAHSELFEEFAATRLQELWASARSAAGSESAALRGLLDKVDGATALPRQMRGVPPEHYRFMLTSLARVAAYHGTRASRPAA